MYDYSNYEGYKPSFCKSDDDDVPMISHEGHIQSVRCAPQKCSQDYSDFVFQDEELYALLGLDYGELQELRNDEDGMMTEAELLEMMEPKVLNSPLKEGDQILVGIEKEKQNNICCDQIAIGPVEIQTEVELSRPTVGTCESTGSLFYTYEDPFWQIEQKESLFPFLEHHGASRNGGMPTLNDTYLYSFIILNLHLINTYRYYHPCFTLSVGKVNRCSSK